MGLFQKPFNLVSLVMVSLVPETHIQNFKWCFDEALLSSCIYLRTPSSACLPTLVQYAAFCFHNGKRNTRWIFFEYTWTWCVCMCNRERCSQNCYIDGDNTELKKPEAGRAVPPSQIGLGFGFFSTPRLGISKDIFLICDSISSSKDKQKVSPLNSGYFYL